MGFKLMSITEAQTVKDYDGNVYTTLKIGDQYWLGQNLKTTRYINGDVIPKVDDSATWQNQTTAAYCNFGNDSSNVNSYGRLYNWYAVNDNRNICPSGWRIPSKAEWIELETYLGGINIAGGKLKDKGNLHWLSPNTDATNITGFTGLGGGGRYIWGVSNFSNFGVYGLCWSSTSYNTSTAWVWYLSYNSGSDFITNSIKGNGFSVRCLCDSIPLHIDNINDDKINIYPNPAFDQIYIDYTGIKYLKMHVYNLMGECFLQKSLTSDNHVIDIRLLKKGVYVLKFYSINGTFERKLIKE
jgi:uncharacterized protein (TIGR02145 family)